MKLISKTCCHVLIILSVNSLFSPLQAWALTISTKTIAENFKEFKFEENTAFGRSVSSFNENANGLNVLFGEGSAFASASENGVLSVSSKSKLDCFDYSNNYCAIAAWSNSINNRNNIKQKYFFDLDISQIILKQINESTAGYTISVLLNNEQIWSSSAHVEESEKWDGYYREMIIAPFTKSLFLGEFGSNQSFDLKYYISAASNSFESGAAEVNPFTVSGSVRTASAVPEPSSILLLGLGLAGLVFWRRRARI